jgi:hypothetical protein
MGHLVFFFNFHDLIFINNFPVFALQKYKGQERLEDGLGPAAILQALLKDPTYQTCLNQALNRHQLSESDVISCSETINDELSKNADGNNYWLIILKNEYSTTEVAAIESIFCALKKKGCIHLPLYLYTIKSVTFLSSKLFLDLLYSSLLLEMNLKIMTYKDYTTLPMQSYK